MSYPSMLTDWLMFQEGSQNFIFQQDWHFTGTQTCEPFFLNINLLSRGVGRTVTSDSHFLRWPPDPVTCALL